MYPHSVPIETGTLPCDGDGVFTILPCFRALNSKKLSFLCKQVTFKLCGMLVAMSFNTQKAFESSLCAKALLRSVMSTCFCILCHVPQ